MNFFLSNEATWLLKYCVLLAVGGCLSWILCLKVIIVFFENHLMPEVCFKIFSVFDFLSEKFINI